MANILLLNLEKVDDILAEISKSSHNADCISTEKDQFHKFDMNNYQVMVIKINFEIDPYAVSLINNMKMNSDPEIIVLSDNLSHNSMQFIMNNNFFEIVNSIINPVKLSILINQAYIFWKQKIKNNSNYNTDIFEAYIGISSEVIQCKKLTHAASQVDIPVLIMGKTGTGKELLANIIHSNSNRKNKTLVTVDCAALPEFLAEAILFGSKKGAYTSSSNDTEGLVTQAHGGSLFLDEIGELPLSLQKILLRVLQEKRYRPIGANNELASDFRLICATNKNIAEMVARGEFRNDLYYRINSIIINPPELKERNDDILNLTYHYIDKFCIKYRKNTVYPSKYFLEYMQKYSWPGNVRELINVVENCITKITDNGYLHSNDLPSHIRYETLKNSIDNDKNEGCNNEFTNLKNFRKKSSGIAERDYLNNLMVKTNYDLKKTCEISGLSRSRLYELMKKFNLQSTKSPSALSGEFADSSLDSDEQNTASSAEFVAKSLIISPRN